MRCFLFRDSDLMYDICSCWLLDNNLRLEILARFWNKIFSNKTYGSFEFIFHSRILNEDKCGLNLNLTMNINLIDILSDWKFGYLMIFHKTIKYVEISLLFLSKWNETKTFSWRNWNCDNHNGFFILLIFNFSE